jgi:beta-1,4-N-acetylglucosaminyltransferase
MSDLLFLILLTAAFFKVNIGRFIGFLKQSANRESPILEKPNSGRSRFRVLAVLGSGGHTTEMLRLLVSLKSKTDQLEFVFAVAESDLTSVARIPSVLGADFDSRIVRIRRIREVGDSLFTALLKMPAAFLSSFRVVWSTRPDVLLCNGPGTCLPIIYISRLLELIHLVPRTVRVFVESFCRVKTISLTGRLVYPFMDSFILQWPPTEEIRNRYPRAKYLGSIL